MAVDTDVLVVGAGPIGLINAWGMKKLNPNLKIVVLEKYAQYQRSHTLVMDARQLQAIMKATHSEQDPALVALLEQLKKDPHIRTNTLQEIFTNLAKESGVDIQTQKEITEENIQHTLKDEYPNVRFIIGADGTHSVVSQALFSKDNQIKYEFDYVLQLRFDISGDEKSPGIGIKRFYQQMARKGLIANEYVGHFEKGKTPVTMQMMISKEDFMMLQKATSKNPLKPFANSEWEEDPNTPQLPAPLKSFITTYLKYKVKDTEEAGQEIDMASIRISVNEAPATHAKKVMNQVGDAHVVLEGDAALGLSYFKGLNAGLEASAVFLDTMAATIQNSFQNTEETNKLLEQYQSWFLNDFSPKKVKEVESYSFWQIRSFMRAMKTVQSTFNASMIDDEEDLEPAIRDYFNHYTKDPLVQGSGNWRPFPHRDYDLVKFGQWEYVPLKHTAKKIAKIFTDYFKPYKGSHQLIQDYKQPLTGVGNTFVGLAKVIVGIATLNFSSVLDGLFSMLRGAIELITTPLSWIVKPITRGVATLIHGGYKSIEENKGIQGLAEYGQNYCEQVKDADEITESKNIYELLAVCNDLHRKFNKQLTRGQTTSLGVEEHSRYATIRKDTVLDRKKLVQYFSLFAPPKPEKNDEVEPSANHLPR